MQSGRADCEALARAARRRIAEDCGMNGNADDGDGSTLPRLGRVPPGGKENGRSKRSGHLSFRLLPLNQNEKLACRKMRRTAEPLLKICPASVVERSKYRDPMVPLGPP